MKKNHFVFFIVLVFILVISNTLFIPRTFASGPSHVGGVGGSSTTGTITLSYSVTSTGNGITVLCSSILSVVETNYCSVSDTLGNSWNLLALNHEDACDTTGSCTASGAYVISSVGSGADTITITYAFSASTVGNGAWLTEWSGNIYPDQQSFGSGTSCCAVTPFVINSGDSLVTHYAQCCANGFTAMPAPWVTAADDASFAWRGGVGIDDSSPSGSQDCDSFATTDVAPNGYDQMCLSVAATNPLATITTTESITGFLVPNFVNGVNSFSWLYFLIIVFVPMSEIIGVMTVDRGAVLDRHALIFVFLSLLLVDSIFGVMINLVTVAMPFIFGILFAVYLWRGRG